MQWLGVVIPSRCVVSAKDNDFYEKERAADGQDKIKTSPGIHVRVRVRVRVVVGLGLWLGLGQPAKHSEAKGACIVETI